MGMTGSWKPVDWSAVAGVVGLFVGLMVDVIAVAAVGRFFSTRSKRGDCPRVLPTSVVLCHIGFLCRMNSAQFLVPLGSLLFQDARGPNRTPTVPGCLTFCSKVPLSFMHQRPPSSVPRWVKHGLP